MRLFHGREYVSGAKRPAKNRERRWTHSSWGPDPFRPGPFSIPFIPFVRPSVHSSIENQEARPENYERIKGARKLQVRLMVVSRHPSDVSTTISVVQQHHQPPPGQQSRSRPVVSPALTRKPRGLMEVLPRGCGRGWSWAMPPTRIKDGQAQTQITHLLDTLGQTGGSRQLPPRRNMQTVHARKEDKGSGWPQRTTRSGSRQGRRRRQMVALDQRRL